MTSKLVIIRGNSGSGKTTIAKEVRIRLGDGLSDNTMLVQQDMPWEYTGYVQQLFDDFETHTTVVPLEAILPPSGRL